MLVRGRISMGANEVRDQLPGDRHLSMMQSEANTTVGNSTLTASSLTSGMVARSGPVGAYTDTLPTVAQLLATVPNLSAGDSFTFLFQNTVAFAATIAVGTGWTLGTNTAVAASNVREFVVTINSAAPERLFSATTTNGSPNLTNVADADCKALVPGMVVAGAGIPAATTILAINFFQNTIVLSANATATGNNIGITADPTATLQGVRTSAL